MQTDPHTGLPWYLSERTQFVGLWGAEEKPVAFRGNCQRVVETNPDWRGIPRSWYEAFCFWRNGDPRPDWIICGIDEYSLSTGLLVGKLSRVPVFCVVEDPPFTSRYSPNAGFTRRIERRFREEVLKACLRHVRGIFCFIEKEILSGLVTSEVPLHQVMNGPSLLALEWIRHHPSGVKDPSSCRIGYVGAINERQGIDDLLEIFTAARKKVSGLRLRLIGSIEDGYEQRYRERCDELGLNSEIEVTGWLPYERMLEKLNACDVCVHCNPPSDWFRAAQPLKVCEYLAARKPTVGWDYPGMRRLLGYGRLGILVPEGDKSAFVEALIHLSEPEKRHPIEEEIDQATQGEWTSDYWYGKVLKILIEEA
jgi:glycosyltransferase involved in cell wall biosynthesis